MNLVCFLLSFFSVLLILSFIVVHNARDCSCSITSIVGLGPLSIGLVSCLVLHVVGYVFSFI